MLLWDHDQKGLNLRRKAVDDPLENSRLGRIRVKLQSMDHGLEECQCLKKWDVAVRCDRSIDRLVLLLPVDLFIRKILPGALWRGFPSLSSSIVYLDDFYPFCHFCEERERL